MEAQVKDKKNTKFFFENKYKKNEKVIYFQGDVFTEVLTCQQLNLTFVYVRDYDNKVIYAGFIGYFNNDKQMELFLSDVIVYDFEYKELYKCDYIYINLTNRNFTMEFNKSSK